MGTGAAFALTEFTVQVKLIERFIHLDSRDNFG
jgi:hypothetical protein